MNNDKIKNTILDFANNDDRVRAVILNGSRANPNVLPDKYQDYDILFVVNNFESFVKNENWVSFLGRTIIKQLPDKNSFVGEQDKDRVAFAWLMIFEDGNRIDLTVFPKAKFHTHFKPDSLTKVWIDKDSLFRDIPESNDKDYHIVKPGEIEYLETCNEFWWVATYVAKGLARGEIIYAKDMMESFVRPMFMKLVEWKAGIENDFGMSLGKSGKFAVKYLPEEMYFDVLKTYSDADRENNWAALIRMMSMFKELQKEISEKLGFNTNTTEADNTFEYILKMKNEIQG